MASNAILITLCSFAALILAYFVYGRFLARRIYQLDSDRKTPAHLLEDGVDYVPTKVPVLFGHHFASIAGLGPILGPAVAVIWGWLPAVIWTVLGSIFVGAVHDLGALTVSLRYKGRSIGDVCRELIGPRARLLFLLIIFFLMSLAMGAFVNAISSLFVDFNPDAIIPSFGLMVVAMAIGVAVYKLRVSLGPATVIGLGAFAGLIIWGVAEPVTSYEWFASAETRALLAEGRQGSKNEAKFESPYGARAASAYLSDMNKNDAALEIYRKEAGTTVEVGAGTSAKKTWIFILLVYGFIASVLPVWLLLQPRDYINSFQLYVALFMLVVGLALATLHSSESGQIHAPAMRLSVPVSPDSSGGKLAFPLLFVTIACGAVSGFHSLVSSGTTVRQLNRETDALPIGFGGMLTEGALAVLVIMCCVAGLGVAAWGETGPYAYWERAGGLAAPLNAVVAGGANFLSEVGIPLRFGKAFLAVTVVAFAMTTLDSATRLLRFNVEELFRSMHLPILANRYLASLIAVGGIAAFGLLPAGKSLWVMFGVTNQLLAGLTLLTVSLFLFKLSRPVWFTIIPMFFMLTMSVWAMIASLDGFLHAKERSPLLIVTSVIVLILTLWLVIEAALSFRRGRGLSFEGESRDPVDHEISATTH